MKYGKWKLTPQIISPATDGDGNEFKGLFLFKQGIMVHLPEENKWVKLDTAHANKGVMLEVDEEQEGAYRINTFHPDTFITIPRWFISLEREIDPMLDEYKIDKEEK